MHQLQRTRTTLRKRRSLPLAVLLRKTSQSLAPVVHVASCVRLVQHVLKMVHRILHRILHRLRRLRLLHQALAKMPARPTLLSLMRGKAAKNTAMNPAPRLVEHVVTAHVAMINPVQMRARHRQALAHLMTSQILAPSATTTAVMHAITTKRATLRKITVAIIPITASAGAATTTAAMTATTTAVAITVVAITAPAMATMMATTAMVIAVATTTAITIVVVAIATRMMTTDVVDVADVATVATAGAMTATVVKTAMTCRFAMVTSCRLLAAS